MSEITGFALLVLLIIETGTISMCQRRLFGTWLTPFTLLSAPYTIVLLLSATLAPVLGFVPLASSSILLWIFGLATFGLSGFMIAAAFSRYLPIRTRARKRVRNESRVIRLTLTLVWICIFILASKLKQVGGIHFILAEGDASALAYASGAAGHIMTFSRLLVVLLIGVLSRKHWFGWISILVLFIMLSFYPVKGWLFMPIIAGLLIRGYLGRQKFSLSLIITLIVVSLVIFIGSYMLVFAAHDPTSLFNWRVYKLLFAHVGNYLFAGVLGWSEIVKHSAVSEPSPLMAFAPFANLYFIISGEPLVNPIIPLRMDIHLLQENFVNVYTFFGTLTLYFGNIWTVLVYTFVFGIVVYFIFIVAVKSQNLWILSAWGFFSAGFVFGWFDYYYHRLAFIEVFVYGLMMATTVWRWRFKPKHLMQKCRKRETEIAQM